MLQAPSILATLPRGPAIAAGKILVSDVHSVAGPRKKKRSEVVTAIDGYGINLYDIRSSRLTTSYAISPLAAFTCPPCSLHQQKTSSLRGGRLTFCSISTPKPTILCFRQGEGRDYEIATSTFELKGSPSRIVHLEAYADRDTPEGAAKIYLLAVHEDGQVRCLSDTLDSEEWVADVPSLDRDSNPDVNVQVAYACIARLETAQKTILKGRDDLTSAINCEQANPNVLILLTHDTAASEPTLSKKQKKRSFLVSSQCPVTLVSFFHSNGTVVALRGQQLLTFQLEDTITQYPGVLGRKRKRNGLLIDAIGCGSVSAKRSKTNSQLNERHPLNASHGERSQWKKRKAQLDKCLAAGEYAGIDSMLASEIQKNPSMNQDNALEHNDFDRQKIDYLLSKLFLVENPRSGPSIIGSKQVQQLTFQNQFPKLRDLLTREGLLTTYTVEVALKREGLLSHDYRLQANEFFEILAMQDPSLQTILSIVRGPAPLTASEIVFALRISIRQSKVDEARHDTKYLNHSDAVGATAARSPISDDGVLQKSSSPSPGGNLESSYQIFLRSVDRLHDCPSRAVKLALMQTFSRLDMQHLVDMLRVELARNGWLAPYIEDEQRVPVSDQPHGAQVRFIVHVLNCVVDALGTAGWLVGSWAREDLAETAETLAYMNAEISAALEGIEEATYLNSMLGEMLICGKNFGSIKTKSSHQLTSKVPRKPSQPDIVTQVTRAESTLPLGLKPPHMISTHRVGAGGELIKRSARDISKLVSKMVPRYSFERINI